MAHGQGRLAGWALAGALAVAGCMPVAAPPPAPPPPQPAFPAAPATTEAPPGPVQAARNFLAVVARVEPVAEAYCRERRPDLDCDLRIVVDDRPGLPPNAFHTLDPATNRPLIGFTLSLIMDVRNADELAFVLGHEAGHHIAGHIPRSRDSARAGALILGTLAALGGADAGAIRSAQSVGAAVGARSYAKDFELEADTLGTVIALRAGYDPERGAAFFARLPDPGNRFLGTHPPNAQRIAQVARTVAVLRAGGRV